RRAPAGCRIGHEGSFTARQIAWATSSAVVNGPARSLVILSKMGRANSEYASGMLTPWSRIMAPGVLAERRLRRLLGQHQPRAHVEAPTRRATVFEGVRCRNPAMSDPLAEMAALLQPSTPSSKLVSGAGRWRV